MSHTSHHHTITPLHLPRGIKPRNPFDPVSLFEFARSSVVGAHPSGRPRSVSRDDFPGSRRRDDDPRLDRFSSGDDRGSRDTRGRVRDVRCVPCPRPTPRRGRRRLPRSLPSAKTGALPTGLTRPRAPAPHLPRPPRRRRSRRNDGVHEPADRERRMVAGYARDGARPATPGRRENLSC